MQELPNSCSTAERRVWQVLGTSFPHTNTSGVSKEAAETHLAALNKHGKALTVMVLYHFSHFLTPGVCCKGTEISSLGPLSFSNITYAPLDLQPGYAKAARLSLHPYCAILKKRNSSSVFSWKCRGSSDRKVPVTATLNVHIQHKGNHQFSAEHMLIFVVIRENIRESSISKMKRKPFLQCPETSLNSLKYAHPHCQWPWWDRI